MNRWLHGLGATLIAMGALAATAQESAAPAVKPPPPAQAFFKPAELQKAELSPSGRYLAAIRGGVADRVGLVIIDLDGKEGSHFISAGARDDVSWFTWVTDDWLVFQVYDPGYRGRGAIGEGLSSVSRDGKTSRQLITRDWYKGKERDVFRRNVLTPDYRFLRLGPTGSKEVLVSKAHFDGDDEYDYSNLYALDVVTGQPRAVDGVPPAWDWWFDTRGKPRVAANSRSGRTSITWLDPKTEAWVELVNAPDRDMPWWPLAVKDESHLLVRITDSKGAYVVHEYDAAKRELSKQAVLTTPGFSSELRPWYDRDAGKLVGMHVLVDAWTTSWFDAGMAALQKRVDTKLPGRVNIISCSNRCLGERRFVVYSYTDTDPGMTLLFTPASDEWQMVGRNRPDIDPAQMSSMQLHRTQARDGEDLPVWVTRPRQAPKDKPAPAVVLVHGGPWARGAQWVWGAERQFLASRGYVVIEPEFRGSEGYGELHYKAGFKQWGLAMQDDVTDALQFAVKQGWVDPKRVCIMGASYGGYAALMGVVKDPDQYRCAVAFAAVSDPRFMFDFFWNDLSSDIRKFALPEVLGDRKLDEARFIATSPLEQASRIKVPVLLGHGGDDRRVPVQNAERMRDALQSRGKPVEWVLYPRAHHGFNLLEDEVDYYGRVERFLAQHLK